MNNLIFNIENTQNIMESEVGTKGFYLMKMKDDKLNIPEGFILTVDFFDAWIKEIKSTKLWEDYVLSPDKEKCDILQRRVMNMSFTELQKSSIEETLSHYLFDYVAVRSSFYDEDHHSFENLYDSFLNCPVEDIYDKIKGVIASLFGYQVTQYKVANCMPLDKLSMAVIIQNQIHSETCGICLTRNPNNNFFGEYYIVANHGIGKIKNDDYFTSDTILIEKQSKSIVSMSIGKKGIKRIPNQSGGTEDVVNEHEDKLSVSQSDYNKVTDLIDQCQGSNHLIFKIEWCILDEKIYLLQVMPDIEAVPVGKKLKTLPDEKRKLYLDYVVATQGYSQPLSVLGLDFWGPYVNMLENNILPEGDGGYLINQGGRQYINVSNMLRGFGKKITLTTLTEYNHTIEKTLKALSLKDSFKSTEKTKAMSKSRSNLYEMTKKYLYSINQSEKDVLEFGQHCYEVNQKVYDHLKNDLTVYFEGNRSLRITYNYILEFMSSTLENKQATTAGLHAMRKLQRMFSESELADDLLALLTNLDSNPVSLMNNQLKRMSCMPCFMDCQSFEAFQSIFEHKVENEIFIKEFNDYIERFNSRCIGEIDIKNERISEDLHWIYQQMKALESYDLKLYDQKDTSPYTKLLSIAKSKNKEKEFIQNAEIYQKLIGYREWPKYLYTVMIEEFRKITLEIGKEFFKADRIDHVDDIFKLHMEEIDEAILNEYIDLRKCIDYNMEPYVKNRYVMNWPMIMDSRGQIYDNTFEVKDGRYIGTGISLGFNQGTVKVLEGPFDKVIEKGDIVVVKGLEPVWMAMLCQASGIIVEVESHEQYEKIIAREYKIPCVANIKKATSIFRDGDTVQINGNMGYVKVLKKEY